MFAHLVLISLYYVYYSIRCIPCIHRVYSSTRIPIAMYVLIKLVIYIAYNCMLNPIALVIPLDLSVYQSVCNTHCVCSTQCTLPSRIHTERNTIFLYALWLGLSLSDVFVCRISSILV